MYYNSIIFQVAFKKYFNLSTQIFLMSLVSLTTEVKRFAKKIANKEKLFLFTKGCSFGVNTAEFSGAKNDENPIICSFIFDFDCA